MGTLNPNLLSKHTSLILNEAAKIMPALGKRLLMPEIALLGLIRTLDTSARRILDKVAQERGFKLSDLDEDTRRPPGRFRVRAGQRRQDRSI
jgi:hypothetical protein